MFRTVLPAGPAAVILSMLVNFCIALTAAHAEKLSVHVVDVGQGDAMIVHQPGACAMLVDAGLPVYAGRVTDILKRLQIAGLDMAIISHPHADHFAGLVRILEDFPLNRLFDNGAEGEPSAGFTAYRELRDLLPYRRLASGDTLQCGDAGIEVLHPAAPPDPAANPNDASLVMVLSFGDFRLLHMGDLAGRAAQQFIEDLPDPQRDLKADVIKIAHHGYEDAASAALLELAAPDHAVISTSGTSCIGAACSPAESVLKRLDVFGIEYFRTDRDGDVEIFVNETGYRVSASSLKQP